MEDQGELPTLRALITTPDAYQNAQAFAVRKLLDLEDKFILIPDFTLSKDMTEYAASFAGKIIPSYMRVAQFHRDNDRDPEDRKKGGEMVDTFNRHILSLLRILPPEEAAELFESYDLSISPSHNSKGKYLEPLPGENGLKHLLQSQKTSEEWKKKGLDKVNAEISTAHGLERSRLFRTLNELLVELVPYGTLSPDLLKKQIDTMLNFCEDRNYNPVLASHLIPAVLDMCTEEDKELATVFVFSHLLTSKPIHPEIMDRVIEFAPEGLIHLSKKHLEARKNIEQIRLAEEQDLARLKTIRAQGNLEKRKAETQALFDSLRQKPKQSTT